MLDDDSDDEEAAQAVFRTHAACLAAATAAVQAEEAVQAAAVAQAIAQQGAARQLPVLEPRTDYTNTSWARMLREKQADLEDPSTRAAKNFRLNFRLPYPVFQQLVTAAGQRRWLHCSQTDAAGRPRVPIELKLLAVLYLLGSGAALRTIAQLSGMSEPTVQRAVHSFCASFSADMYKEWISPHQTDEELQTVLRHYTAVGFPGAVGSTDVTHIPWDKTPCQQARYYTGKEGFNTIAYEVTVDHRMRIEAVTQGFHGAVNDKTIVRYDGFVQRVRTEPKYTGVRYKVRVNTGSADDQASYKEISGAYLIVDGGYHKVSVARNVACACKLVLRHTIAANCLLLPVSPFVARAVEVSDMSPGGTRRPGRAEVQQGY